MAFLGRVVMAANAVSSDELVIADSWRHIHVRIFIAGSSSAGVARLLVGGTSIDATGTYNTSLLEGATLNTTSVSAAGWPLAVATTTTARFATIDIYNVAGTVKRMVGHSSNISVTAAAITTQAALAGIWVNTAVAIQRMRLSNFDVLTGTTLSANTLTAATELYAWGHNDDGG